MKNFLALFLLPLAAFTVKADWKTVTMDEQAIVVFPSEPQYSETSGNKVWMAEIDSASSCTAMVLDFENYGLDSQQVVEELNNQNAFEIFKKSLLDKMEGATILSENEISESGITLFEFIIDRGEDAGAAQYLYSKSYFAGTKMYTLNFYGAELEEDELSKRFFESFKIKEL